jgi:DNA-binding transcriptional LysR family regulator
VTLTQLRAFLAVARLGAVKAAAQSLEVTEPAVSGAVACLRRELGDPLFVRSGGGIVLTPGGRRLAASAADILGLADEARRNVGEIAYDIPQLRVAAPAMDAEYLVPPVLEVFRKRYTALEASTLVIPAAAATEVLRDMRADVVLGPHPVDPRGDDGIESISVMRYQLVIVSSPGHVRQGNRRQMPESRKRITSTLNKLASENWLVGPSGLDPETLPGAFLLRLGVKAEDVRAFPSMVSALDRVAAGDGLSIVFAHVVFPLVRDGRLTVVDVPGTPLTGLLWASALSADRRSPTANALLRWITTPMATHAMQSVSTGVPMNRFRPPVYANVWENGNGKSQSHVSPDVEKPEPGWEAVKRSHVEQRRDA